MLQALDTAKHPLSEAGGGAGSKEYSGTESTTPSRGKEATLLFLVPLDPPLLARRGRTHARNIFKLR